MIHSDGDVYSGDWIEDQAEGYGKYEHGDGGSRYEGGWKEN